MPYMIWRPTARWQIMFSFWSSTPLIPNCRNHVKFWPTFYRESCTSVWDRHSLDMIKFFPRYELTCLDMLLWWGLALSSFSILPSCSIISFVSFCHFVYFFSPFCLSVRLSQFVLAFNHYSHLITITICLCVKIQSIHVSTFHWISVLIDWFIFPFCILSQTIGQSENCLFLSGKWKEKYKCQQDIKMQKSC